MRAAAMLLVTATLGLGLSGEGSEGNASRRGAPAGTGFVSDSFERAALGSSWNVHAGTPGIVSGSALGLLSGSIAILSWAAPLPADQFSEAQIAAGIDETMQRQVFVRRRTSDSARYAFHYNLGVSPQRWELKYDGVPPSQTKLLATAMTPSGPVPGDVIRIEAESNTIRGYKNGQLVLQTNDSSAQRLAAGAPGMALVLIGRSVAEPSPVFERWAGGALSLPEPKILKLSRSGSLVRSSTVRPTCFSVRFVSSTRFRYTFTVRNVRKRVVWRDTGLGKATGPKVIRWCGRTKSKAPGKGKPLPVGRYRAKLEVSVARAGKPPAVKPFFARTWPLELRT